MIFLIKEKFKSQITIFKNGLKFGLWILGFELWIWTLDSSLKLGFGWRRLLLLIPALIILVGSGYGFSWFFARSLAVNANQPEIAAAAVFLAPSDALAHSQLARFKTRSFDPAEMPAATRELELAAALAPNDYRYWFALTRMRERAGDAAGAEQAAQRAVELAPNFAQVLWLSGNILLRRGRQDEAFKQMRRAAEADPQFAIHFINAAAQTISADDLNALRQIIGDNASIQSSLVVFLMQSKKLDAAIEVWQDLPEKEKRETGKELSQALLAAKKYRAALKLYEFAVTAESEKPRLGRFLNGGFENDLAAAETNPFAWQIAAGAQPQIAPFAGIKHAGERSLIIVFNSPGAADFRSVSQTVVVESNSEYHFEIWVKAEKLQSDSKETVFWEVMNAADNRVLAKTIYLPIGDNDWQKLSTNFKTAEATEAVTFRLARAACSKPPCAIIGKIWFDDFLLQKVNK